MNKFNICKEIRCPYAYKSGCDRYSVSNHCHLIYPCQGERRFNIETNQYWLFADEADPEIDINQLRDENQTWLQQDETTQRRIQFGFRPFEQVDAVS